MDIFGADFFPPNFTTQSRINGMEGVNRSIDLVLRVSRDTGPLGYAFTSAYELPGMGVFSVIPRGTAQMDGQGIVA